MDFNAPESIYSEKFRIVCRNASVLNDERLHPDTRAPKRGCVELGRTHVRCVLWIARAFVQTLTQSERAHALVAIVGLSHSRNVCHAIERAGVWCGFACKSRESLSLCVYVYMYYVCVCVCRVER